MNLLLALTMLRKQVNMVNVINMCQEPSKPCHCCKSPCEQRNRHLLTSRALIPAGIRSGATVRLCNKAFSQMRVLQQSSLVLFKDCC